MAVRFVFGRAGAGKSQYCLEEIAGLLRHNPLGPAVYWIVPSQATFSAEHELTCAAGLRGFCRARVVSFELLARQVLAECGGCATPEVTPLGRRMLLSHLLRQHRDKLGYFNLVAHHPGLAARLDGTFSELERRGLDPQALDKLIDEAERAGEADVDLPMLVRKLRDLRLLYGAYRGVLGHERLDPHGRLMQMLERMSACPSLQGASVFVDGFLEFTQTEQRMLARLARVAERVEICLLMDPADAGRGVALDELRLMHRCERAYRSLSDALRDEGVSVAAPHELKRTHRFAAPALAELEATFDRPDALSLPPGPIEFIEAPDRRDEVAAAAGRIRQLLLDGLRLREISVLVRDLNDYHELIDAAFRERGLDYFVDRRRPAMHHPLLRFVRAALAIARDGWPNDAVMTLLKCGLSGLSLDQADEIENYACAHRIAGAAWTQPQPWSYQRELTRPEEADLPPAERAATERVDAARRSVVDRLAPFTAAVCVGPLPVRRVTAELFELLERFNVRSQLARWMEQAQQASDFEQRDEHEQVWAELTAMFDQMIGLLGDEPVSLEDFAEIVEAGFDEFDFALAPATLDQVLVGQVDRTRMARPRVAIVLGLNDGVFPQHRREDSILADGERQYLSDRGVETDPDTTRRLLDERLLAYLAFTRASERLIVTRCCNDSNGQPLGPSPLWQELRRRAPDAPLEQVPRDPGPRHISAPRQLITGLMDWVRADAPDDPASPWPALYHWLATHECCDDAVDRMRYRAWAALSYSNEPKLSADVAARLFASPLHASVTRIEAYAACPFRHFLIHGLGLSLPDDPDVTALDLGNLCHGVLEGITRDILTRRADFCALEAAARAKLIHDLSDQIGRTLRDELMLSSARNSFILEHIEQTLGQVVAAQQAAMQRGEFRPVAAEVGFGMKHGAGESLPALVLKTPKGRSVHLRGKIDRVDVNDRDAQFAVIDYKLSANKLDLDRVFHGLSLQLLTYLLVLEASGEQLLGRAVTPAAAFYVQVLRRLQRVPHPDEAVAPDDPLFPLRIRPRGLFDVAAAKGLDGTLTSGQSDVVQLHIKQDDEVSISKSDAAPSEAFAGLLRHVQQRIIELADQIMGGSIGIHPYRMGRLTPCPTCDFRSVCRFDPATNAYHSLPRYKRDAVLEMVRKEAGDAR